MNETSMIQQGRRACRRYWAGLRANAVAMVTRAETEDRWGSVVGKSCALSLVLVGGLHWVEWSALKSGSHIANVLGAGLGLVLAGLGLAVLARIYWRIQVDVEDRRAYVLAALSSLATVGVCTVAFAGLTTMLCLWGVLTPDPSVTMPGLARVEVYYLWQLVDVVPLLDMSHALRWAGPLAFSDPWSGALLLAFKILLLIPLFRVLLSGARWMISSWLKHHERMAEKHRQQVLKRNVGQTGRSFPQPFRQSLGIASFGARVLMLSIAVPLFMYGILALVVRGESLLDRWVGGPLNRWVGERMDRWAGDVLERWPGDHALSYWLATVFDGLGALLLVSLAWGLISQGLASLEDFFRSFLHAAAGAVLLTWWLLLATLAVGAVTITMLHAGIAETSAPVAASAEVSSALEWYAWSLADTVPALDVPQTLNWSTEVEFVDRWTGALLLLMRLLLVVLLLVPLGLVFRMAVRRSARTRARRGRPLVEVASELTRSIDEILSLLDEAEQVPTQGRENDRGVDPSDPYAWLYKDTRSRPDRREAEPTDSSKYYVVTLRVAPRISALEDVIERLVGLVGEGETADSARAAAASLEHWSEEIQNAFRGRSHTGGDTTVDKRVRASLRESRLDALAKCDEYVDLASRQIRAAAPG
ncbi:hypothetical protein EV649_5063 [Kribbella sp. VKM Ac-2569]|uniref:hypothetical protein n=1 Tax=Kribbella sp. VKM Ac-2569 TaxID=2512220 RepID=UPI00102CE742|nr:hypothetical protein [Kribbella sp. VKM Ac-2569]RZT17516.1 hypothetical protein EV649_5063 [Kribbella sp. VKM Ac-2569]